MLRGPWLNLYRIDFLLKNSDIYLSYSSPLFGLQLSLQYQEAKTAVWYVGWQAGISGRRPDLGRHRAPGLQSENTGLIEVVDLALY